MTVETGEGAGELQVELEGLRKKVRRGRRRSALLTYGTLAALVLGLICWGAYYNSSVLSFAEVEKPLSVEQATREARRCLRCDLEFTQPEEHEAECAAAGEESR